jgi:putative tryptophan/tyrosine transport system substrate-binding protein
LLFSHIKQRIVSRPATSWLRVLSGAGSLAFILALLSGPCPAEETKKVLMLLSGDSPVYQKVADNTIKRIEKHCKSLFTTCPKITYEKIDISDTAAVLPEKAYIVITFGTRAASFVKSTATQDHLILAMLPRQSFIAKEYIPSLEGASRIFLDQPYSRYFELIKATMPRVARVGLLLHASDSGESKALQAAAEKTDLILKIEYVENVQNIGEPLSRLLGDIDVFLAIPDSRIHNNKTISNILTTAYRNHIPVVGFSSAYVKAGATEAIYTSLDDIAHQVSDVTVNLLTHHPKKAVVQQAKYFSVSFNFEVARSLGLTIRSPSAVEGIILRGE